MNIMLYQKTIKMPPRRGPARSGKRTTLDEIPDVGSARVESQEEESPPRVRQRVQEEEPNPPVIQNDEVRMLREEMKELRAENRALREEMTRGRLQVPSLVPIPPAVMPRRIARRIVDDEGVSVQDFLKMRTPEFTGDEGEDPQEFLEETEKMVKRLPCSDARAIELVGINMKKNAWEWFQRNMEDKVYSENPPTWEEFKQAVMDEFISPAERQNRALQFERLKQVHGMSVSDYAREFIRLSKYAPHIVPTETARVERFRSGLFAPLYNAVLSAECSTLSKLIDKAKQWEIRNKEERMEREQRKKGQMKGQGNRGRTEGTAPYGGSANQSVYSAPPGAYKGDMGRNPSQSTTVRPPRPTYSATSVDQVPRPRRTCWICGKMHLGHCRFDQRACHQCGQIGHFIKDCPHKAAP